MIIQFEAPDGTVLERVSQSHITESALPRIISSPEGCYWYVGIKITREHAFLPVYRLAREVSTAVH